MLNLVLQLELLDLKFLRQPTVKLLSPTLNHFSSYHTPANMIVFLGQSSLSSTPSQHPNRQSWTDSKRIQIYTKVQGLLTKCSQESLDSLVRTNNFKSTSRQETVDLISSASPITNWVLKVKASQEAEYLATIHARFTLVKFGDWALEELHELRVGQGMTEFSATLHFKEQLMGADPSQATRSREYNLSCWAAMIKKAHHWRALKWHFGDEVLYLPGDALLLGEYVHQSMF